MNETIHIRHTNWLRKLFVIGLMALLMGCAQGLVNHDFSFDMRDSPSIQILNYRYGNSLQPSARPTEWEISSGNVRQGVGIHGEMLRGDELYVKWKIKTSGRVFEETVDLKTKLPRDIKDHKIYFILRDAQLFVYLITPERRPPDMPPVGPAMYHYRKVITLSSTTGREVFSN